MNASMAHIKERELEFASDTCTLGMDYEADAPSLGLDLNAPPARLILQPGDTVVHWYETHTSDHGTKVVYRAAQGPIPVQVSLYQEMPKQSGDTVLSMLSRLMKPR